MQAAELAMEQLALGEGQGEQPGAEASALPSLAELAAHTLIDVRIRFPYCMTSAPAR